MSEEFEIFDPQVNDREDQLWQEVERLREEKSKIATLCEMLIREYCWEDTDGGSVQDEAERLGILEPRTVTAEMLEEGGLCHNASADFNIGDTAYFFADWVRQP